jgi:hypothetical protein
MGDAEDAVRRQMGTAESARQAERDRQFREANAAFRALLPRALDNMRRRNYDVCPITRKFILVSGEERVAWQVESTRCDGSGSEWYLLTDGNIVRDGIVVDSVPSYNAVLSLQALAAYPDRYHERRTFGRWLRDWLECQGILDVRKRR